MKLRCPFCGGEGELPQFTQAAELLALDKAAAAFGEDWRLINQYLDCFAGKRPLKAERRLGLAKEIYPLWRSGKFEFNRCAYLVERPEFLAALATTCNQVTPPLSNHHYLLRVLTAAARQTSQRREREFKAREQGLRAGDDLAGELIPPPIDLDEDPEWQQEFFRLGKAARRPGLMPEQREAARAALQGHIDKKKRGIDADL